MGNKYQESVKTLNGRLGYHKNYYKKNKEKWRNEDGTWKNNTKHDKERYEAKKKMLMVSGGTRKGLTTQQKRFQKSLRQGNDLIRAIQVGYPKCDTPEKITHKLFELRKNTILSIDIKDFFMLSNDLGMDSFYLLVKQKMIIDEAEPGTDPRLFAIAQRGIENMMKWAGKTIERKETTNTHIWKQRSLSRLEDAKKAITLGITQKQKQEAIETEVVE